MILDFFLIIKAFERFDLMCFNKGRDTSERTSWFLTFGEKVVIELLIVMELLIEFILATVKELPMINNTG